MGTSAPRLCCARGTHCVLDAPRVVDAHSVVEFVSRGAL